MCAENEDSLPQNSRQKARRKNKLRAESLDYQVQDDLDLYGKVLPLDTAGIQE